MQSKGAIKLVALLIGLACAWQLSFTLVTSRQEKKAAEYAEQAVLAEQNSPAFQRVSDLDKVFYLDSIRKEKNRFY
jgi:SecD/SecF fusion protein